MSKTKKIILLSIGKIVDSEIKDGMEYIKEVALSYCSEDPIPEFEFKHGRVFDNRALLLKKAIETTNQISIPIRINCCISEGIFLEALNLFLEKIFRKEYKDYYHMWE